MAPWPSSSKNPCLNRKQKTNSATTDVRAWIVAETRSAVVDFLHKNAAAAQKLQAKINHNEQLRKELNAVKKEAKEAARKVAIKSRTSRIANTTKATKNAGGESTIFITEGPSAAGSMVAARDVTTQAIFGLKGVPLNVFGKTKAAIYKNAELYNLMTALGIEDSVENLRFNRVVIATDADYDGFHIRNLLMTFFSTTLKNSSPRGMSIFSKRPFFACETGRETRYCYSEKESATKPSPRCETPEIYALQGIGGNLPERIWAIHRPGHAPHQSGRARPFCHPKHPRILHGQKHARPQRLYRGEFDIGRGRWSGPATAAQKRIAD